MTKNLRITGQGIEVGQSLAQYAEQSLSNMIEKYFSGNVDGQVTFTREGHGIESECLIHLDGSNSLYVRASCGEARLALESSLNKLEKRLRRYKRRLISKRNVKAHNSKFDYGGLTFENNEPSAFPADSYIIEDPIEPRGEDEEYIPTIIAQKPTHLPTLSVGDAVIEMDMAGANVLVFKHAASNRVNIIYRRTDNNIAWIDPTEGIND